MADDVENVIDTVVVQGNIVQGSLKHVLEACYTPIIQSGDQCSLKFSNTRLDLFLIYSRIIKYKL